MPSKTVPTSVNRQPLVAAPPPVPSEVELFMRKVRGEYSFDEWMDALNLYHPLPSPFPRLLSTAEIAPAWAAMKAAEAANEIKQAA